MARDYDDDKDAKNVRKHGVSLARYVDFDLDQRKNYGEPRWVATGWIEQRLHVLCYTLRDGRVRPISLRKANKREVRDYETQA